ncbi:MAG: N-acetyltransferase [Flavobacterium sp.]|nr:N-acetyltransferase [Pedobacter sp.]
MKLGDIDLIDNKDEHSYELWVEKKRSFINYNLQNNQSVLLHTEVPEELQDRGIAAALVEKTFQYLESKNMKVVPICSYIRTYLKQNPKWNHLVANNSN